MLVDGCSFLDYALRPLPWAADGAPSGLPRGAGATLQNDSDPGAGSVAVSLIPCPSVMV